MKKENFKFIEEFDPVRKRRMLIKSRSITGIVPVSEKEAGVWFESGLERDFILLTRYNPDVEKIEEQPLRINYDDESKAKFYTPDFMVTFKSETNKKNWLCEIKYESELRDNFQKFKPRFKAAKTFCETQGWEFKIFTEKHIRTPLLDNINFLSRYNYNDLDPNCYKYIVNTLTDLGTSSPAELMLTLENADYNLKGRCLYALWYAIKLEDIGCNLVTQELSMDAQIWINHNRILS